MNDTAPLPPPPADARPVDATPLANGPQRLQRPIALFLATTAMAAAIAVAVGTVVGLAVGAASASDCSPNDGWCDLGAALIGVAFGGLAGVIAYVVAGVVIIRRFRPQGDRAKHVAAHLAFPPAVIVTLSALSAIVEAISRV